VFPSIAAAAAWAYVDRRRIREALQNGSAAGGYYWAAPGAAEPAGPALPPAEGEVAELVAWLERQPGGLGRRAACARVAELLQRQAAELERLRWVAVAERLPGAEDFDGQGRCWWLVPHQSCPCVYLMQPGHALAGEASHWRSAASLPLPGGEVG